MTQAKLNSGQNAEDAQRAIILGRGVPVDGRPCRTEVAKVNRELSRETPPKKNSPLRKLINHQVHSIFPKLPAAPSPRLRRIRRWVDMVRSKKYGIARKQKRKCSVYLKESGSCSHSFKIAATLRRDFEKTLHIVWSNLGFQTTLVTGVHSSRCPFYAPSRPSKDHQVSSAISA